MTKEEKLVISLLKSVKLKKPVLNLPLVISTVALVFLFGITALAYFFSTKPNLDLKINFYFVIATSFLVYGITHISAKFAENSYFSRACQQWCFGNLDFIATFVIERPHTKKFYKNPASLMMISKVLYEIGDEKNSLLIKQDADHQNKEIEEIHLDSPKISTKDENILLNIWRQRL